jgi:hypothetical protein
LVNWLCLKVLFDEVKVGGINNDIVFPYGFDCPNKRVIKFDIVLVKDRVGLAYNEEDVLFPFLFKFGELNYLTNTFINQMLNLSISIEFQLLLKQQSEY